MLISFNREGHYETTALLLERGAQVNVPSGSNDDTPLTLACWKGELYNINNNFNLFVMKYISMCTKYAN